MKIFGQMRIFTLLIIQVLIISSLKAQTFSKEQRDAENRLDKAFGKLHYQYNLTDTWTKKSIIPDGLCVGGFDLMIDCDEYLSLENFVFNRKIYILNINFKEHVGFHKNLCKDEIEIRDCEFHDHLFIYGSIFSKNINVISTSANLLTLSGSEIKQDLKFENCIFDSISLYENKIEGNLEFRNCTIKTIGMNSNSYKHLTFQHCILPDKFKLKELQPSDSRISFINFHTDNSYSAISINVTGCDLTNVDMDYQNFRLDFDSLINPEEKRQAYLTLLENFKKKGQMDSYRNLDLDYKRQFDNPVKYFIQTFWWNYGYSKDQIFQNSGRFLIVFTFLTLWFYKKLQSAYPIENAETNYGRFINSFIYTNIIFWAFKLDIKQIKFRDHLAAASYIMLMYLTGILCLAYMVNYVIQS